MKINHSTHNWYFISCIKQGYQHTSKSAISDLSELSKYLVFVEDCVCEWVWCMVLWGLCITLTTSISHFFYFSLWLYGKNLVVLHKIWCWKTAATSMLLNRWFIGDSDEGENGPFCYLEKKNAKSSCINNTKNFFTWGWFMLNHNTFKSFS